MNTKRCGRCRITKAFSEFHRSKATNSGYRSCCKVCAAEANKAYNTLRYTVPELVEKNKARCQDYHKRNKEVLNQKSKAWRTELRSVVYQAYGNSCQWCGESNFKFLTLDHVNGDGAAHRREIGGIAKMLKWAKDNNYPTSLRLLCYNCNCGRERNGGICPHLTDFTVPVNSPHEGYLANN